MSIYLDIPWEESKYLRMKYRDLKPRGGSIFIYSGAVLPPDLKEYRATDFSYARWLEDDARGKEAAVTKASVQFTPQPHQREGAKKIRSAHSASRPGFLLADRMGLGKTLTSLLAVAAIAQADGHTSSNKGKLLVVCPKSVIPVWRQTIQSYHVSTNFLRIMVINYQQLNKLLKAPTSTGKAKKARTKNRATAQKGEPLIDFDYVVFDEAQSLKNYPSSATSLAAASIAKLNSRYVKGKSPFVIYSTATPGNTPLNFAIMANFMAPLISATDDAKSTTPATWGAFLAKQGFTISKGAKGYNWITMPW